MSARSAHREGRTCGGSTPTTKAPPPRPTGAFTRHSVANGCEPARSWTLGFLRWLQHRAQYDTRFRSLIVQGERVLEHVRSYAPTAADGGWQGAAT